MIQRAIACLLVVALLASPLAAQPASVMVLPIDGTADASLRDKLTKLVEQAVVDLGAVKAGTTTLGETAVAIGCDPNSTTCAESVRAMLLVDVLIFGNATTRDNRVELVVTKVEKGKPAVVTTQLVAGEQLDPAAMREITGKPVPVTCTGNAIPQADGTCRAQPRPKPRTERVLGISILVGAGLLAIAGLTQWNEKSNKQKQIDAAPTETLADFQNLERLEDDAASKATAGNLLMLGALGATAAGIWLLRRDRKAQRDAMHVTPAVTPTSAGVVLSGAFR